MAEFLNSTVAAPESRSRPMNVATSRQRTTAARGSRRISQEVDEIVESIKGDPSDKILEIWNENIDDPNGNMLKVNSKNYKTMLNIFIKALKEIESPIHEKIYLPKELNAMKRKKISSIPLDDEKLLNTLKFFDYSMEKFVINALMTKGYMSHYQIDPLKKYKEEIENKYSFPDEIILEYYSKVERFLEIPIRSFTEKKFIFNRVYKSLMSDKDQITYFNTFINKMKDLLRRKIEDYNDENIDKEVLTKNPPPQIQQITYESSQNSDSEDSDSDDEPESEDDYQNNMFYEYYKENTNPNNLVYKIYLKHGLDKKKFFIYEIKLFDKNQSPIDVYNRYMEKGIPLAIKPEKTDKNMNIYLSNLNEKYYEKINKLRENNNLKNDEDLLSDEDLKNRYFPIDRNEAIFQKESAKQLYQRNKNIPGINLAFEPEENESKEEYKQRLEKEYYKIKEELITNFELKDQYHPKDETPLELYERYKKDGIELEIRPDRFDTIEDYNNNLLDKFKMRENEMIEKYMSKEFIFPNVNNYIAKKYDNINELNKINDDDKVYDYILGDEIYLNKFLVPDKEDSNLKDYILFILNENRNTYFIINRNDLLDEISSIDNILYNCNYLNVKKNSKNIQQKQPYYNLKKITGQTLLLKLLELKKLLDLNPQKRVFVMERNKDIIDIKIIEDSRGKVIERRKLVGEFKNAKTGTLLEKDIRLYLDDDKKSTSEYINVFVSYVSRTHCNENEDEPTYKIYDLYYIDDDDLSSLMSTKMDISEPEQGKPIKRKRENNNVKEYNTRSKSIKRQNTGGRKIKSKKQNKKYKKITCRKNKNRITRKIR